MPAIKTEVRNTSKAPRSVIAVSTIAVKPAAGPETLMWDLLISPTTIPPTTPEIIPENNIKLTRELGLEKMHETLVLCYTNEVNQNE